MVVNVKGTNKSILHEWIINQRLSYKLTNVIGSSKINKIGRTLLVKKVAEKTK
jgi:hypothetical protein